MRDYLRDRFPLQSTSTVYMSGKAVYNLVRFSKPGIITPIELLPGDAAAFREAVREAQEEAWDEGFKQGGPMHDVHLDDPDAHTRNPYRKGETDAQA